MCVHSNSILTELEHAISTRSGESAVMLHRITDLFLANTGNYSVDQLNLYDDIFVKIVEKIEVATRAELARHLAPIEDAPTNTIRSLVLDDDIEVAEPVLAQSKKLDDDTLAHCAATKGQQHLLAISTRMELSEKVSDQLVKHGDKPVLSTLVSNPGAKISAQGFETLVQKSVGDDWLTEIIALRKDIPERHFRELISKASGVVHQRLNAANPKYSDLIQEVLDSVGNQDVPKTSTVRRDYRMAELVINPLANSKRLTEYVVKEFAAAKKVEEVIFAIAHLANLSTDDIERLIMGTRSSPVAVVLKAIGFHLATVDAIYCSRLSNGEAMRDDLRVTKLEFINLKRPTAERIMRFYKARC
jgi:hypothetical protein